MHTRSLAKLSKTVMNARAWAGPGLVSVMKPRPGPGSGFLLRAQAGLGPISQACAVLYSVHCHPVHLVSFAIWLSAFRVSHGCCE